MYSDFRISVQGVPCKDCSRREVGCHAVCEEFKIYREHNQEYRDARFKENLRRVPTANRKKRIETGIRQEAAKRRRRG